MYEKITKSIGHYTSFFTSLKDTTKWFYANDGSVSYARNVYSALAMYVYESIYIECILFINYLFFQIIPVSTATVLQQHPFMLFYEQVKEGILYYTRGYMAPL